MRPDPDQFLPARWAVLLYLLTILFAGCGNSSQTSAPTDEPANPFAASRVGTDSTLEVMTWNLESFAKNGDVTADLVTQVLQAVEADIIGLQEITSSTRFEAVVAGLDGWDGFRSSSSGYSLNLAFIYRTDGLLEVESVQEIMTGESAAFPRAPLLLLGSFGDQPIAVINNHLKCCGNGIIDENDAWDEETRRQTACLLLEEYALAHLGDRAVFLIGDFNDEVTDAPASNVFANFLGDPAGWRIADLPIAEGPATGWSFPGWPSHLDHIIINQALFTGAEGPEYLVRVPSLAAHLTGGWTEYDQNISDHLPVVLRIRP